MPLHVLWGLEAPLRWKGPTCILWWWFHSEGTPRQVLMEAGLICWHVLLSSLNPTPVLLWERTLLRSRVGPGPRGIVMVRRPLFFLICVCWMYCVLSPLVVLNVFSVSVLDSVPSFVHFVLILLGICCTSAMCVFLSPENSYCLLKYFFYPIFSPLGL